MPVLIWCSTCNGTGRGEDNHGLCETCNGSRLVVSEVEEESDDDV